MPMSISSTSSKPLTVSAKVNYACLAMLGLAAEHERGQPVPLRNLADTQNIPSQFLSQILQQLRTAGLVQSSRGACGGYRLTEAPDQITLADVVSIFETQEKAGSARESTRLCRALQTTWQEIEESRHDVLASTTFADLLTRVGRQPEPMYYI